ncbi:MAG: DNA-directed RNA polymerase subunit beta, partial [Anaerovoracaceae bacterium]
EEGLREVFEDISPISDYSDNMVLEIVDYSLSDPPKFSVEKCKERDATYATPLKVKVRLITNDTGEIKEQEVFMGDFPLMTEKGTFIYNGAERVVVTQLVRSPGTYFSKDIDKNGRDNFTGQIIPNRGGWIEFETDAAEVLHAKVDRNRKLPLSVFAKAMGQFLAYEAEKYGSNIGLKLETDKDVKNLLGKDERLLKTLEKDTAKNSEEALKEIYKRLRPGEPPTVESAKSLIGATLFDPRRYDISKVGRFKYNKKLGISNRLEEVVVAENVVDPNTGELLAEKDERITLNKAIQIENAGVKSVLCYATDESERVTKVTGNNFVSLKENLPSKCKFAAEDVGLIEDKVYYPVLMDILSQNKKEADIKQAIIDRKLDLYPKNVIIDDIIAAMSYFINLNYGVGSVDDIDHLGNRRLRTVGELLQNQFRMGLSRMEKVVRERMTVQDVEAITPQALMNIRPVTAAIKEFFGSSQLSQFMDQTNPLAELTHKRRLSALGPGGLSRERAGFEVRDVHHSHYGRMCPIETPEGPNIGLIGSLTTYGIVNKYGFIETPYRVVKDGYVSDEIRYLSADEEDRMVVAQANEPLTTKGKFANERVAVRGENGDIYLEKQKLVDYMDVSPKQVVSVATALIPFLENDDANRALMGANMQRQAVPLMIAEAPIIGTGMEHKAAKDSGVVKLALSDGIVESVDANLISIKNTETGEIDEYKLLKFKRSNQGTCVTQRPIVFEGEKVEKGEVIADGPATDSGELALGKNLLVGFMTWEGYNYEDAIILNEKLIMDDVLTSLHVEKYEALARDTKLGAEEITRDIPNSSEMALASLDEEGIIAVGTEVKSRDILVGKITPKGETDLSPEEKLLRAIFGEKAKEVRDSSLRLPHGEEGVVVDVQVLSKESDGELPTGVNKAVRCYVATKRKISVGDKMAGRHGNKGVISRILPQEDMPFTEDGTQLQVMLNPLGVPSRMNVGQVLEVHLGLAAKKKGWFIATPVFDGANENDIINMLEETGYDGSGKLWLRDGRTGRRYDSPVTVGYMYMLKLHHLVDDKIHARSTGPYSLVTQQPLGGKAQFGGQRFGEMEVWALEAYGAAYTLQEILTVKSDDVIGRVKTYEAIVKGENIPEPGVPESFKVLIKEMQSLGLDVRVMSETKEEVEIIEEDTTPVIPKEILEKEIADLFDNDNLIDSLKDAEVTIVQHLIAKSEEELLEVFEDDFQLVETVKDELEKLDVGLREEIEIDSEEENIEISEDEEGIEIVDDEELEANEVNEQGRED